MSWLLGPEIGHNNLAQAIGIALASGAEIYGLGHEDFRRAMASAADPTLHKLYKRQSALPGAQVRSPAFGTSTA
jgi:hypothetical protein